MAGLLAVTACGGLEPEQPAGHLQSLLTATGPVPAASAEASPVAPPAEAEAATRGRPPAPVAVRPLAQRVRPDVLVTGPRTFSAGAVERLTALARDNGAVSFRAGTVRVGPDGAAAAAVGVDPSSFRAFTAQGTAEADAVWQAVARGEAVASHAAAKELGLELGSEVQIGQAEGATGSPQIVRVGAFATTGVPAADLVVDDQTGRALGLPAQTGMLLVAPEDQDAVALGDAVREITGEGAALQLLTQPAANPVAFLTGSKAAQAFGAFSYRYFPDGTIQPDASWVRDNIVTTNVPIMGRVTCHRLMVPQLRGALQEVQDAGLGHLLKTYDGCYVPRFIARNPDNSISLHTWGIAIDMDASTNYRGIRGTMDMRIVEIFKRWGFRWGGDWTYTDPMHFELGALLTTPGS